MSIFMFMFMFMFRIKVKTGCSILYFEAYQIYYLKSMQLFRLDYASCFVYPTRLSVF
jgi:hypothetical protein